MPYPISRGQLTRIAVLAAFCVIVLPACISSSSVIQADRNGSIGPEGSTEIQHAVRPGTPGSATDVLSKAELVRDDLPPHTEADTHFMQGMISHHAQALVMTEMVPARTNRPDLLLLSKRIDVSQGAEIKLMQRWLRKRDESVPMIPGVNSEQEIAASSNTAHYASTHAAHAATNKPMTVDQTERSGSGVKDSAAMDHSGMTPGMLMPGMLTSDDLATLSAAKGDEFYRLFLKYMIGHHEGALTMVADLFAEDGAVQDSDIFLFASDVDVDQRIEIDRMRQMLSSVK